MALSGDREIWKRGCSECRGPEFEDGDRHRKIRNCDGSKPTPTEARYWAPELRQCPWSLISDPEVEDALEVWRDWKNFNVLPCEGDLLTQPAFVFELITVAETARCKEEIRRAEQADKPTPKPAKGLKSSG